MVARHPELSFERLLTENVSDEQLDAWESQYETDIARLTVLLAAVRASKEARRAIEGGVVDSVSDRPGSMIDAVLTIMNMDERLAWSSAAILNQLRRRGWEPKGQTPKNSVDATLSRMVTEGHVVRPERGVYALPNAKTFGIARSDTEEDS